MSHTHIGQTDGRSEDTNRIVSSAHVHVWLQMWSDVMIYTHFGWWWADETGECGGVDSLNHLIMSVRASYTGNRKWLRQGEDGESSCKSPWENLSLSRLLQRGSYLSPTHSCGALSIWGLICIFSIESEYLVLESIFAGPAGTSIRQWLSWCVFSLIECDRGGWVFTNGSERWSDIRHNTWRAKGAQLRKTSSLREKLQLKMDVLQSWVIFWQKLPCFFLYNSSNWLCTNLWT